jgi:hypothetical protein
MIRTLAATALLLGALATPAGAREFKEFKDIVVSCTDGLTCSISLKVQGTPGELNTLSFTRRAGPGTGLGLIVAADSLDAGSNVTISVDGKQVLAVPVAAMQYNPDWLEYTLSGSADPLTLLDAMRNGLMAEATAMQGGKPLTATHSLSGLVAGLIFVDEVQGRLDMPDALQVKGTKTTPPIKARDIEAVADIPEGMRAEFEGDGQCAFMEERRFALAGGFEVELGDGFSLLALPCGEGGAYNQPFVFYTGYENDYDQLWLPTMGDKGPTVMESAYNIGWDQKAKVLDAFFKGRGLGDCGSLEKWEMDVGGIGPAFTLIESRVKDDCDGDDGGGIENWPLLWPVGKN